MSSATAAAPVHPALWLATLAVEPGVRLAAPRATPGGFPAVADAAPAAAGTGSSLLAAALPVAPGTPVAAPARRATGFPA